MTLVYPTNAEYVSALKSGSQRRFTEPLLQRLEFEKRGISLAVMTGGLAIVFKATDPITSKKYALRCFKGDAAERNRRYSEISAYLNAKKTQLPFVVEFKFYPNELRVKTADGLPVVLMQWVDGSLLKQWLQARSNDANRSRVLQLAEKWRKLITVMRSHNLAHGDLQHGNVLVTDSDEFILIDYDGMAVPSLHGPDSPELGLPGYQHRERTSGKCNKLSAELDNFSAINIYLCLRALAIDPQLINRFGDHDEGLLFHPQDMECPDKSARFDQLKALRDVQFLNWIDKFRAIASGPLSRVPSLEQFLCDPIHIIKALDEANWERAVELADEADLAELPSALVNQINKARVAVDCRRKLKLAVDSGDERRIADAWDKEVFSNYPAARDLAGYGEKAIQVIPLLEKLQNLLTSKCVGEAVAVWDKNAVLLSERASAQRLKSEVESWRKRVQLAERAKQLLTVAATTLIPELVQISDELESLGGYPELSTAAEFLKAVQRNRVASRLAKLSQAATAEGDKTWSHGWDAALFAGYAPVAAFYAHYLKATGRRAEYDKLFSVVSNAAAGSLQEEQQIIDLASRLPPGYCPNLSRRSVTAAKRIEVVGTAANACAADATTTKESALAATLVEVRSAGAEPLLSVKDLQRLLIAEKRASVLQQLSMIPAEDTFESDARILALWNNEELLRDCAEAARFRPRYVNAQERSRLLAELLQAKEAGDEFKICDIAVHPLLRGFKHDQHTQYCINQARQTSASFDLMQQQLAGNQGEGFARQLDVDLLNRFWPRFKESHEKIRNWMLTGTLKPEFIGLAPPALGQAIRRTGATVKIKWQFPSRVTETCLVTLSRGATQSATDLKTAKILLQQEVTFRTFEQGGSACVLPVGRFEGNSICVWAIVEICGERFYSAPLNLGRIPSG